MIAEVRPSVCGRFWVQPPDSRTAAFGCFLRLGASALYPFSWPCIPLRIGIRCIGFCVHPVVAPSLV